MTPKQEAFVREYLIDLNATQAAIRAGYSERTAGSQSFDLLQKPEIQAAIAAGRLGHQAAQERGASVSDVTDLEARRRQLAGLVGCYTEGEILELTGYTSESLKTMRKRREFLPFMRVGTEYLYPIDGVKKAFFGRLRQPIQANEVSL